MASGGARNRSGPGKDLNSARSSGLAFTNLPAGGFDGDAPEFPLPIRPILATVYDEKDKKTVTDGAGTTAIHGRELELWSWAWTTPQAVAWSREPWRWPLVAMWVRTYVICEGTLGTAADKSSLHRFADQIGMTPAGLKENGWNIVHDEMSDRREPTTTAGPSARDRLRAVANDS